MRLLNFASRYPEPTCLETERTLLQRPQLADYKAWADLRRESSDFLRPFEPTWAADELTRSSYRARLRKQEADITSGRGLPWFIFNKSDAQQLLGGITLSNIRRGVAETGTLGYWMGKKYASNGFMKEAVMAVCDNVFGLQKLHRIEAATVIENRRSQALLERCGFQREGIAREYLRIDGSWRDHILFARLAEDQLQV